MDNGLSCGPSLPLDPWPTGEQLSAKVFLKSLSVPQLRGNHVYGAHQKRVWRLSSCLKDLKPWKGLFILRLSEPEQGIGPFWEGCAKAPVPSFRAEEALQEFLSLHKGAGPTGPPGWGTAAAQVPGLCPPTSCLPQPWVANMVWDEMISTTAPLGLDNFRKTLHMLLSEVRSEHHGRATL